jgi:hypothetical protein
MTLALAFLSNFQGTMVFLSLIQGDYFCMVSKREESNLASRDLFDAKRLTNVLFYRLCNIALWVSTGGSVQNGVSRNAATNATH